MTEQPRPSLQEPPTLVEDIRARISNIFEYYDRRDGIDDQIQEEVLTLFSTILDGLVMEERKPQKTEGAVGTTPSGHHVTMDFTAFGGKRWETGDHWEGQTILTEED